MGFCNFIAADIFIKLFRFPPQSTLSAAVRSFVYTLKVFVRNHLSFQATSPSQRPTPAPSCITCLFRIEIKSINNINIYTEYRNNIKFSSKSKENYVKAISFTPYRCVWKYLKFIARNTINMKWTNLHIKKYFYILSG